MTPLRGHPSPTAQVSRLMEQDRPITSRAARLAVIALTFAAILGIYLRWWNLGGPSLWFDEGYTAWLAGNSPSEIIRLVRADTAPPLYYLLLHGWMRIFGSNEIALRSFSCVCATLTLAIVYALCRRQKLSFPQIAVVLSLLSMSVLQVRYARDARCYALVSLFAAIQLYSLFAYREKRALLPGLFVILASAAMLYTHNMTLPYLAALLGGWVLFGEGSPRRRLVESSIAGIAVGLLFLPWVSSLLRQVSAVSGHFWIPRPGLHELMRTMQVILGLRDDFAGNLAAPMSRWLDLGCIIAVAGFAAITVVAWNSRDRLNRLLLCYAISPVIVVFLYSLFRTPLLIDRAFLPSSVALAIFAGIALTHLQTLWLRAVIPLVMVLSGISSVGYIGYEQKEDWRSAIAYVDSIEMRHPRTLVFLANEGELLHRYYARRASRVTGLPHRFLSQATPRAMQRVETPDHLAPLHAIIEDPRNAEITLVVSRGSRDRNRQAMRVLNETCRLIDKRTFPNISVYRFAIDEDLFVQGD